MNDPYVLISSDIISNNCDKLSTWLVTEIGEVEKEWDAAVYAPNKKVMLTFRTEEQKVRFILTWGNECGFS